MLSCALESRPNRPPAACHLPPPTQEVEDPPFYAEDSSRVRPSLPRSDAAIASTAAAACGSAVAAGLYHGIQSGFVTEYLTPDEVYQRCKRLEKEFPHLVEVVERPYRTHGYDGKRIDLRGPAPLYYVRVGLKDDPARDDKTGVVQTAAPHAREWMQPMIMTELLEQLVRNFDPTSRHPGVQANTELVRNLDIYIVPCSNPDGTNYSMVDDPMWRKTRSPQAGGEFGVDCNRNFNYQWKANSPADETFSGPRPESEPETRNVADLVDEHPNIRYVCDWHSHGEEVRRPEGVSPADRPFYDVMHQRMAAAIQSVRGRQYKVTESKIINGASDDFFYHRKGLWSTIVEDGREFHPEPPENIQVMQEGVAGARELLHIALTSPSNKAAGPGPQT